MRSCPACNADLLVTSCGACGRFFVVTEAHRTDRRRQWGDAPAEAMPEDGASPCDYCRARAEGAMLEALSAQRLQRTCPVCSEPVL